MRRRCETQNFSERKLDDESQDSVQTVLNFEEIWVWVSTLMPQLLCGKSIVSKIPVLSMGFILYFLCHTKKNKNKQDNLCQWGQQQRHAAAASIELESLRTMHSQSPATSSVLYVMQNGHMCLDIASVVNLLIS